MFLLKKEEGRDESQKEKERKELLMGVRWSVGQSTQSPPGDKREKRNDQVAKRGSRKSACSSLIRLPSWLHNVVKRPTFWKNRHSHTKIQNCISQ